jgi:hypothetical protein
VTKRTGFFFADTKEKLEKYSAKPGYSEPIIYNENLVGCAVRKSRIKLNKPIFTGFCILELSKVIVFNFWYNILKKRFGDKVRLLYIDTDGLTVEIETHDVYADLAKMKKHFDFSKWPVDHPLHSMKNRLVPGYIKEESEGQVIKERVSLQPKHYCQTSADPLNFNLVNLRALPFFIGNLDELFSLPDVEKKKAAGAKKSAIEQQLDMDDYLDTLRTGHEQSVTFKLIESHNHQIIVTQQNRVALAADDQKRFILDDGINTLAYGHWRTRGKAPPQSA